MPARPLSVRENLLFSFCIMIACVAIYILMPHIRKVLRFGVPPQITAVAQLTNHCPIPDHSFVLQNINKGRTVPFSKGLARIKVTEGDYVELGLSARHTSEVTFNSFRQRATENMAMIADCAMDDAIEGTTGQSRFKTLR